MNTLEHAIAGFDPDAAVCRCGRRFEYSEWGGTSHAKELAERHARLSNLPVDHGVDAAIDQLIEMATAENAAKEDLPAIVNDLDTDGSSLGQSITWKNDSALVALVNEQEADGTLRGWHLYVNVADLEAPFERGRELLRVLATAIAAGEQLTAEGTGRGPTRPVDRARSPLDWASSIVGGTARG